MYYESLDFPLISKIKHALGATLLLTASLFYLYGIFAPAIRITGVQNHASYAPYDGCLVTLAGWLAFKDVVL